MNEKTKFTEEEAIESHLQECVRCGWMEEVNLGKYRLTPAGIKHVEEMLGKND